MLLSRDLLDTFTESGKDPVLRTKSSPQLAGWGRIIGIHGTVYSTTEDEPRLTLSQIRKVVRDPVVQLARLSILSPMVHTPWIYTKGARGTEAMQAAVRTFMEARRVSLLRDIVFNCLDYGYFNAELVYEPVEDRLDIAWIKPLLPGYAFIRVYEDTGRFAGLETLDQVTISVLESFTCSFETRGTNWYGESVTKVLKPICDSWSTVESAAGRYDAKIAGATWIIYYPVSSTVFNGVDTPNEEIAAKLLDLLESSGKIAIPDEVQEYMDALDKEKLGKWRIELISANANATTGFVDRQKYLDALKIRAFGIPERALLEGSHGTKEEASVHTDVLTSNVDTRHRLLCEALNLHCVDNWLEVNYGREYRGAIKIEPAPLVDAKLSLLRTVYQAIAQNGDTLLQEYAAINLPQIRTELGIPMNGDPAEV